MAVEPTPLIPCHLAVSTGLDSGYQREVATTSSANPLTCKWCGSLRVRIGLATAAVTCKHCDRPCGKGAGCGQCSRAAVKIDLF